MRQEPSDFSRAENSDKRKRLTSTQYSELWGCVRVEVAVLGRKAGNSELGNQIGNSQLQWQTEAPSRNLALEAIAMSGHQSEQHDGPKPLRHDLDVCNASEASSTSGRRSPSRFRQHELCKERQKVIDDLCSMCRTVTGTTKPLNIVLLGKPGAGKSSLINTIGAGLGDFWHEYARTGQAEQGKPVTIHTKRYSKCCMERQGPTNKELEGYRKRYRHVLLPTLIDVAGLSDEDDERMEQFLTLLFYGHIKEHDKVMEVYNDCQKLSPEEIRSKYSTLYPEMKADRVVFVASAADDDPLPEKLMACVERMASSSHEGRGSRAIPLCGVLTKKDKTRDVQYGEFPMKKARFTKVLGLNMSRFDLLSCYCDEINPEGFRRKEQNPELDIPVLEFLKNVCDPALEVTCPDERLPKPPGLVKEIILSLGPYFSDLMTSLLVALVALATMHVELFYSPRGRLQKLEAKIEDACKNKTISKTLPLLCTPESSGKKYFEWVTGTAGVVFGFVIVLMLFILQLRRRLL